MIYTWYADQITTGNNNNYNTNSSRNHNQKENKKKPGILEWRRCSAYKTYTRAKRKKQIIQTGSIVIEPFYTLKLFKLDLINILLKASKLTKSVIILACLYEETMKRGAVQCRGNSSRKKKPAYE